MGEVYYGELIKGSEIGAHMACPWGIASIMAALGLVCTQGLRLNVKYVYTVIGYKDCDPPPLPPQYLYLREEVLMPSDCLYFPPRHHHYIIRLRILFIDKDQNSILAIP